MQTQKGALSKILWDSPESPPKSHWVSLGVFESLPPQSVTDNPSGSYEVVGIWIETVGSHAWGSI